MTTIGMPDPCSHITRLDVIRAGIDWMTLPELSQAIPPAYTEFIGAQLLQHLGVAA